MRVLAPAKLTVSLSVTGVRPDAVSARKTKLSASGGKEVARVHSSASTVNRARPSSNTSSSAKLSVTISASSS